VDYDSSADFWKVMNNGDIVFDGKATVTDEDGNVLFSLADMGLNSEKAVESALMKLLGLADNPDNRKLVTDIMYNSGLRPQVDPEDPNNRSEWYWLGEDEPIERWIWDPETTSEFNQGRTIDPMQILAAYNASERSEADYAKVYENVFEGRMDHIRENAWWDKTPALVAVDFKLRGEGSSLHDKQMEGLAEIPKNIGKWWDSLWWDLPPDVDLNVSLVPGAVQLPSGVTMNDVFATIGFDESYFRGKKADLAGKVKEGPRKGDDIELPKCNIPPVDFLRRFANYLGEPELIEKWRPLTDNRTWFLASENFQAWEDSENVQRISFSGLSESEAEKRLYEIALLGQYTPILFAYRPPQSWLDADPNSSWHNAIVGGIEGKFNSYHNSPIVYKGETIDRSSFPFGQTPLEYDRTYPAPIISLMQAGTFTDEVPINYAVNGWRANWRKMLDHTGDDSVGRVYFYYLKP
jgi:hypothetical protein